MTTGIDCMLMRGGSSKGAFFLAADLPDDESERDDLLERVMGSPDDRQIDGIGGAHPLTSKVAIVSASADPRCDVDYLFLQVGIDGGVSDAQNCGNLLAAVGPFAVERGLIDGGERDECTVAIMMRNTNTVARAQFPVCDRRPRYDGGTSISGVPGTAAAIRLDFEDVSGATCGSMLPTGHAADLVEDVTCTLIDNGMPVVVMRAADLGVTGYESCAELEADRVLRDRLERIRLDAGERMGLGDVTAKTVPKLTLTAAPRQGGHIATRTFIPHRCHQAIGVLGAVSVATAALLDGSPAHDSARPPDTSTVKLEHPSGFFDAEIELRPTPDGSVDVTRAGIVRTARKLMDGTVFPRPRASSSS